MTEARKLDLRLIGEIYDLWNRGEVEATLAYDHLALAPYLRVGFVSSNDAAGTRASFSPVG
jgi:hypothetical protein